MNTNLDQVRHKMADGKELSKRELEAWLRDIGMSKKVAKTLLARGFAGINPESELSDAINATRNVLGL